MSDRYLAAMCAVIAVVMLMPMLAAAQSANTTLPRTPWGDPDLQGTYTNKTITPLQRPRSLPGKNSLRKRKQLHWKRKQLEIASWIVLPEEVTLAPTISSGSIEERRSHRPGERR